MQVVTCFSDLRYEGELLRGAPGGGGIEEGKVSVWETRKARGKSKEGSSKPEKRNYPYPSWREKGERRGEKKRKL